jgi:hypothetical protein
MVGNPGTSGRLTFLEIHDEIGLPIQSNWRLQGYQNHASAFLLRKRL